MKEQAYLGKSIALDKAGDFKAKLQVLQEGAKLYPDNTEFTDRMENAKRIYGDMIF